MAYKKKVKKEDLSLKTKTTNDGLAKPVAATGKNKIFTTDGLKRPEKAEMAKTYKPGEDVIIKMGRNEKPRKWRDKKK